MSAEPIRAAVVQLLADEDTARNIARAGVLVEAAVAAGAGLVVLPEKWNWWGPAARTAEGAEPLDGPSLSSARAWARGHGVAIIAGSVLEAIGDGSRAYNTSVLIGPDGMDVAIYRKVHLFDVTVAGREYRESESTEAGEGIASGEVLGIRVGLSVCYDLRFPELYRALADEGARVLTVPANFTRETGRDHWEVLLRARAIEDQCFVLASGQCGEHVTGEGAWGHSMIIDPWGTVLGQVDQGEGHAIADLDLTRLDVVRAALPVHGHRRLHARPA